MVRDYVCVLLKYVRFRNTRREMYVGHVACCHLVSYAEYVPRALLRLEKDGTDKRTDATPMHTLTARRGQRNNAAENF